MATAPDDGSGFGEDSPQPELTSPPPQVSAPIDDRSNYICEDDFFHLIQDRDIAVASLPEKERQKYMEDKKKVKSKHIRQGDFHYSNIWKLAGQLLRDIYHPKRETVFPNIPKNQTTAVRDIGALILSH